MWLTDGGKEPVTANCRDGNPPTTGPGRACLNANPTAQALAAAGYLRLPGESSQVQRVYYYDFDGQNAGWDSGLVNISTPLLGPHGYGAPRTAWCVFENYRQGARSPRRPPRRSVPARAATTRSSATRRPLTPPT